MLGAILLPCFFVTLVAMVIVVSSATSAAVESDVVVRVVFATFAYLHRLDRNKWMAK